MPHSVTVYVFYDMEQTLTLLITVFRSNFRCHVLIISGKADEGPKDKKRREVISVL